MKAQALHGLLVIDKPGGMTSRAVVNQVQQWFPRGTRIGHTGTLDPLATGVLVLCLGVATRLAEYVQDMSKTYRAGIRRAPAVTPMTPRARSHRPPWNIFPRLTRWRPLCTVSWVKLTSFRRIIPPPR